jgi:hypothetical protein
MGLSDAVVAGLIAGIYMGVISQLGYWLGIVKSHLVVIDGAFALKIMKQQHRIVATYTIGAVIHLATGIIFGMVYYAIARIFDFDLRSAAALTIYVLVLWLAMLAVALPVAGQGFAGQKIRRAVWLEQLVLHIVFGFGFWWALGID